MKEAQKKDRIRVSLFEDKPILCEEWDYENNGDIKPTQIPSKSNKKVWWKCKRGHSWYATVVNRTNLGRGCPYCSNQIPVIGENDLQTLHPEIASQWHPTKNGNLSPKDVTSGSKRKIWWICERGHDYSAMVKSRVSQNSNCPYCANKVVLKGFNDLETVNPELAKEWDYRKNDGLLPSMVTYGSGKKVWWICRFDHSFEASIYNRVHGRGCPICSSRLRTSFPEQAIFFYVKKVFPDAISRDKETLGNTMELDVYIPSIKTAIEYDGKAFHSREVNKKRDERKYQICKSKGISLIRIREETTTDNSQRISDYRVNIYGGHSKNLIPAIESLFLILGKRVDINLERDKYQILEYLQETQTSLQSEFPDIANEWHQTKNGTLLPSMFYPGSNQKVWWICSRCGREWKTSISERTGRDRTGCPNCSRFDGAAKNVRTRIHKKGSLELNRPDLMKEWDYPKNMGIDPKLFTCGSGKKVWWKCSKCGNEWEATINHRTNGKGCPICKIGKITEKTRKPVDMISPENNKVSMSFISIAEAQRVMGIYNIQRGLKDPNRLVGGYYWRYSERQSD